MTFSAHNLYTKDPGLSNKRFLFLEPKLVSVIVHLGWPVIVGMLSQTTINTVDLILVGRLPDTIAVNGTAAMLSSLILLWAFGGFLSAISVGTQTIAARRYSEGNLEQAGQVLFNSICISTVASLVVLVIAELTLPFWLSMLTPTQAVYDVALSFCRIRLLGLFSMALMASYKSFYDSMGRVRIHMFIAIAMNIINLILSLALIFGFQIGPLVIPALLVDGAAWGSVLSSMAGLIMMVAWSLRQEDKKCYKVYRLSNWNWASIIQISKISLFSGLASIILMGGVGLFNRIVGLIDAMEGQNAINTASASIIIHIMMLVFMTCLAFGTSTATLVSQSIGVNKMHLAKRYTWQSVILSVYTMGTIGILIFFFPKPLLMLFLPADFQQHALKEAVIAKAIPSLRLAMGLLSPIAASAIVLTQALYGAGQSRYIMVVELVLHFGVLVPCAWLFGIFFQMGLQGCWIAVAIYAVLLLAATAGRFAQGKWQNTKL